MQNIRQLTQKGDPMVRATLPAITIRMLKASAKQNKRRIQDQFIKVLAETFKNDALFASTLAKFLPDIKEVYQPKRSTPC